MKKAIIIGLVLSAILVIPTAFVSFQYTVLNGLNNRYHSTYNLEWIVVTDIYFFQRYLTQCPNESPYNTNMAWGHDAGILLTTGSCNVLLGEMAGRELTYESNRVILTDAEGEEILNSAER